jgi:hypothetical protein
MTTSSDMHREAAQKLLVQARGMNGGQDDAAAAGRLYELFFRSLAPVIGAAGYRGIFARAIKLSKVCYPALTQLVVLRDSPARESADALMLADFLRTLDAEKIAPVSLAVYSALLELLTGLLGERLTWRFVHRVFAAIDESASKETE